MSIKQNIEAIRSTLPAGVELVCVSKFHPASMLLEAYHAGEHIFGESRVQELKTKVPALPADIQWHFIGHLQTNKVKNIVPLVSLIHSVDSLRLLQEINKEAAKIDKKADCLIQIHIAREESKFGFSFDEAEQLFQSGQLNSFDNIDIKGFMGMATLTGDKNQIRKEFQSLKRFFDAVKTTCFANSASFSILSMGMSDDYPVAVEEGSTMIRVGSSIFGESRLKSCFVAHPLH